MMMAEIRPLTPTSGKRGIKDMVEEVVEGKKRKLGYGGILFDPEGVRGKGVVVGLKLGSVLWEVGNGGVLTKKDGRGGIYFSRGCEMVGRGKGEKEKGKYGAHELYGGGVCHRSGGG